MHISHRVKGVGVSLGVVIAVAAVSVALSDRYIEAHDRVAFSLTNQHGDAVTQKDFRGRYLLVFFGFTNCDGICPTHMSKLTRVMAELDGTGSRRSSSRSIRSATLLRTSPRTSSASIIVSWG